MKVRPITIGLSAALLLSACGQSKAERAEEQAKFLEAHHANLGEVCGARRAVAAAYLEAQDNSRYDLARAEADVACTSADLQGRGTLYGMPTPTADDLEDEADNVSAAGNEAAVKPKPSNGVPAKNEENEASVASTAQSVSRSQFPDNCYKGYCPCDPPQGGPDSQLCDQLEEGLPVDVQLMIAGKAMREARRQIETGDY